MAYESLISGQQCRTEAGKAAAILHQLASKGQKVLETHAVLGNKQCGSDLEHTLWRWEATTVSMATKMQAAKPAAY